MEKFFIKISQFTQSSHYRMIWGFIIFSFILIAPFLIAESAKADNQQNSWFLSPQGTILTGSTFDSYNGAYYFGNSLNPNSGTFPTCGASGTGSNLTFETFISQNLYTLGLGQDPVGSINCTTAGNYYLVFTNSSPFNTVQYYYQVYYDGASTTQAIVATTSLDYIPLPTYKTKFITQTLSATSTTDLQIAVQYYLDPSEYNPDIPIYNAQQIKFTFAETATTSTQTTSYSFNISSTTGTSTVYFAINMGSTTPPSGADMLLADWGSANANGTFVLGADINGYPSYYNGTWYLCHYNVDHTWKITDDVSCNSGAGNTYYYTDDDVVTPDLVTTWIQNSGDLPLGTVTATGGTPGSEGGLTLGADYEVLTEFSNIGVVFGGQKPFPDVYLLQSFTTTESGYESSGQLTNQNASTYQLTSVPQPCGLTDLGGCIINAIMFLLVPSKQSVEDSLTTIRNTDNPLTASMFEAYDQFDSAIGADQVTSTTSADYHFIVEEAGIDVTMFSISNLYYLMDESTRLLFRGIALVAVFFGFLTMVIRTFNDAIGIFVTDRKFYK